MANEYTGKNLYFKFGTTVLTSRFKSMEPSEEIGLLDSSAGSDTARTKVTTLEDGAISFEFLMEAAGSAEWDACAKGTFGTCEWGEEGTASGKPKHTVYAVVKSRKKSIVHDDIVKASVEFEFSGALSDTNY